MSKENKKEIMKKYYDWVADTYKEVIHFNDFQKRIHTYKWLDESLTNFYNKNEKRPDVMQSISYCSIWRHEVLDNLKFHISPKKTECVVTVFKMDRTRSMGIDRSAEFHTTFAFLYSSEEGNSIEHQYICLGPTYQSADGEYRSRFITFKQFKMIMAQFKNLVDPVIDQVVKWIGKKSMGIQMEAFFPNVIKKKKGFEKIQKTFLEKLDKDRLIIEIYAAVWLLGFKQFDDNSLPNHLVPGYKEVIFAQEGEKFYFDVIKKIPESQDGSFNALMERVIPHSVTKFNPAYCGQKLIPLRVKDVEESMNIKHAPWREMYIAGLVGDMVINGICAGFPIFVDWFFIPTNSPDIWDNKVSHLKLDHSMVATEIVRKIEDARKSTYIYGNKGEEVYATYQMEGMSDAIEVPMSYAEKELILAPVTLCSLVEHVGRTFADMPVMIERDWYRKETGDIFGDVKVYSKYLFEYIYAIYCMNKHFHLIHTDLHLNNIAMNNVRYFHKHVHDPNDQKPLIKNAHVVYDIGETESTENVYVFPHYGRYSTIIDFSRGVLGREQLLKDFPEHTTDQIISNQRRRLQNTFARELPDFYKSHSTDLEALLLQDFDLAFKLLCALDTYKLSKGMLGLIAHNPKMRTEPAIIALLERVNGMALHTLTVDMQKAFRRDIKDYENPNLHILKTCFTEYTLDKFDQKAARRDEPDMPIAVIDVWQSRNLVKYNTREYKNFPPNVKFDYVEEHNIPIDKGGLQNFHKHQKYLSTNPEKRIHELAEEVRDERAERRGTPPPPKKSTSTEKIIKATTDADFLSSSPVGGNEKPIKETTQDKPSDEMSTEMKVALPFNEIVEECNPPFKIETIKHPNGFDMTLVNESKVLGCSKQRLLSRLLLYIDQNELVYVSNDSDILALGACAKLAGKTATVFVTATKDENAPMTKMAETYGVQVKYYDGPKNDKRYEHIQAQSRKYAQTNNRYLINMKSEQALELYKMCFKSLEKEISPKRIWVVAESGLTSHTLAKVFPKAKMMIVQVGSFGISDMLKGINHQLFSAPESSDSNYDKLWKFVVKHSQAGDVVINSNPIDAPEYIAKLDKLVAESRARLDKLLAETKDKTIPRVRDVMLTPKEMFANLQREAKATKPALIVNGNYTETNNTSTGLSNHFTEDERMRCVVNKNENISPEQYWKKYWQKIVPLAYWYGGDKSPNWLEAMGHLGYPECNTFNPLVMTNLIKKFCKSNPTVLDPSMGWGDRLLGALAIGVSKYVGFDPNLELHDGYKKIISEFADGTPVELHADKFSAKGLTSQFDLVMTSPPFYNQEIYTHTEKDVQKSYDKWVEDMFIPYLTDAVLCVKPGGHIAIYIDNVKRIAPMADTTNEILKTCGLQSVGCIKFRNAVTDLNGIVKQCYPRSCWVYKKPIDFKTKTGSGIDIETTNEQKTETKIEPKIEPCNLSTEEIYARYLTVRKLDDLARKYKLDKYKSYELHNILERYLLTSYPNLTSAAACAAMTKHLAAKSLPASIHDDVMSIIQKPVVVSEKPIFKVKIPADTKSMVTLSYGKLTLNIPRYRYGILLKQGPPEDILHCALSYATLLPNSQHWAIPLSEYKRMVTEGATIEGFSSAYNSQIVRVDPTLKYCSLMECDKHFGSLGNFFDQDFSGKTVIVNPPFTEDILERAAKKCLEELEKGPCKFIFYGPTWTDSAFYQLLDSSKWKVSRKDLKKFTYGYEDLLMDKSIKAPFDSVVFTLERL